MADIGSGASSGRAGRATQGRPTSRLRQMSGTGGALMLASMLDILMAILFFLLKNYSSVVSDFSMGKDLTLPSSTAMLPPIPALQLQITQKAIILDEKEIVPIVDGEIDRKELYRDGVTIVKLAQALKGQKDKTLFIDQHNDKQSFNGTIIMQADKNLKFSLLKKVIYTAGITDFVMLKLAVLKKDES